MNELLELELELLSLLVAFAPVELLAAFALPVPARSWKVPPPV